ncbi:hypothetical protein W97_03454 [Coniosporium apollinis CBS 100218]|uniref:Asl1-like glycosyl hydrolase catalytic domain-containing protein n=1 Tax=Coniosporium apollinis (strain CBS 100218) TaxID=1168221 RepID=R7YQZ8_CONA1|nr:uncharacterized protein W97_03454 [Coniosporium apollinis CBS 100218]EON64224.1 hypothetical protein W97_03454 [Coniosporium apollinis CBS 100218]
MATSSSISAATSPAAVQSSCPRSQKRGLVYVASSEHPEDDLIWAQDCANISWYYNYGHMPSIPFASDSGILRKRQAATSSPILYIPMLWGDFPGSFLSDTVARIQAGERVPYVLGFNEPDLGFDVGGSSITPARAAEVWVQQLEPLRGYGVSLGAPAVSGSQGGFAWLRDWFAACAGRCNPDFLPAHYYGDFSGLAGHLGQIKGTYPNLTIWVTEFAYAHSSARNSEIFLNQTLNYFDVTLPPSYGLTHYSYFGGFRSDVSNVGAGATLLDANGKLTNIGRIYLGQFAEDTFEIQSATTATPTTGTSSLALTSSSSGSSSSLAMPSPSLLCPQSNGTSYRVNGIDFTIQCYVDHYGGNYPGSPVDVDNFEEYRALLPQDKSWCYHAKDGCLGRDSLRYPTAFVNYGRVGNNFFSGSTDGREFLTIDDAVYFYLFNEANIQQHAIEHDEA